VRGRSRSVPHAYCCSHGCNFHSRGVNVATDTVGNSVNESNHDDATAPDTSGQQQSNPTPPRKLPTPRSIRDWTSPAAIAAAQAAAARPNHKQRHAEARAAAMSADPASLAPWQWRKLPRHRRFAHLHQCIFHMVEPSDPNSPLSSRNIRLNEALTRANRQRLKQQSHFPTSNLFHTPATIHRIVAFERDLAAESANDNKQTAEVALVGRSNAGKSSLLNKLLINGGARRMLSQTSKTPGKTQMLYMFSFEQNRNARIVDCPGYGYARAKNARVEAWNVLLGLYLRRRRRQGILRRVLVLLDARRGMGPLDEQFCQFLEMESIPYQLVLTKVDLLPPRQFDKVLQDVRSHLAAMPQGKFATEEARREYEAQRAAMEAEGEDMDDMLDEENQQWQDDVASGEYATTSSLETSSSALPAYSCSIPLIHAVSSREGLGISALQQSLTKMLILEPNKKFKLYKAGEEGEMEDEQDEDEEEEDDENDSPPIPVSYYDADFVDSRSTPKPANTSQVNSSSSPQTVSSHRSSSSPPQHRSHSRGSRTSVNRRGRSPGINRGVSRRSFSTNTRSKTVSPTQRRPHATTTTTGTLVDHASNSAQTTTKKRRKSTHKTGDASLTNGDIDASIAASAAVGDSSIASAEPTASDPSSSSPLSSSSSSSFSSPASNIGLEYQRKTPRQHILDRSETYIGSMHHQTAQEWVMQVSNGSDAPSSEGVNGNKMNYAIVQQECSYVPALLHIFDEILVNAADNQHRDPATAVASASDDDLSSTSSSPMSYIRVSIDRPSGRISISNDGASIPVVIHPSEGIPVPELIFGHLLTSSNYDDKQQRYTGGRHGYGAKLTNIFSREFKVEIQDVSRRVRYEQVWRNNMSECSSANIVSFDELLKRGSGVSKRDLANNYTRITFVPDYARFGEEGLSEHTAALMQRRVLDIAACVNANISKPNERAGRRRSTSSSSYSDSTSPSPSSAAKQQRRIKVYLNDQALSVDSFPKYLALFPQPTATSNEEQDDDDVEADTKGKGKWVYSHVNDNWQVAVGPSLVSAPSSTPSPSSSAISPPASRDLSFVNSIFTSRGGTHVSYVSDKLARAIQDHILRTHKTIRREQVTFNLIKQHMSLLVNCKIPNPAFSSQTKELLMTPSKQFGSECTFNSTFLTQVCSNSTGIVPAIVESVSARAQLDLLRQNRLLQSNRLSRNRTTLNTPKLEDAHWAGSSDPNRVQQTTLILTEGDSAKALVLSSLAILGRERYGVFPLKGKMLNVRDATIKQVMDNKEIQNVLAIVGLEIGARYEVKTADGRAITNHPDCNIRNPLTGGPRTPATRPLRYGRIMLMTDQDHDGSHIKGLFINLLHTFWPELLVCNAFLDEFVTAIIKVRHRHTKQALSFHTMQQYNEWRESLPPPLSTDQEKFSKQYTVKYYKGLGTNTAQEGKEYFKHIDQHRVKFVWQMALGQGQGAELEPASSEADPEPAIAPSVTSDLSPVRPPSFSSSSLLPASSDISGWIRLAFSKSASDARKHWLATHYHPSLFVDTSSRQLPYEEFINRELIVFSHADNIRSIPSMVDGLKPVQRKILYACFKRNLKSEIKVAQLSGYVSEQTVYHHGEASLQGSIINMAQSFIGSNNIALLHGAGQFGSRHAGGKDAAAARYIFTSLSPLTRALFPSADDPLLHYRDEDGQSVEPNFFVPILPLVLVNGAEGIGTGFSTQVPTFNPSNIIENIRRRMKGEEMKEMIPWIRGFKGAIEPVNPNSPSVAATDADADTAAAATTPTQYLTSGLITWNGSYYEISELPAGRWPEDYKTFLHSLISSSLIRRFADHGTDERVNMRIWVTPSQRQKIEHKGPLSFFKLTSTLSLTNMHLFNVTGLISKYASPIQVLDEFYPVRVEYYRRRREREIIVAKADKSKAENKMRFIEQVMKGEVKVYNRRKSEIVKDLQKLGYATSQQLLPRLPIYADHQRAEPISYTHPLPSTLPLDSDSFDYLLNLPLSSLTAERLASLRSERDSYTRHLHTMEQSTEHTLWKQDLEKLEQLWMQEMKRDARKNDNKKRTIEDELEDEDDAELVESTNV